MRIKRFNESVNKPKIYLAGGWGKFRDIIQRDTNADWLNPESMTGKSNWFELEVNAIKESDGVIAWFEDGNKSGFGMTYEMGIAFALDIPYILICEDKEMLEYKFSMQSKGSVETFTSWEDALKFINDTNWMGISNI